jgi:hypothetical protein
LIHAIAKFINHSKVAITPFTIPFAIPTNQSNMLVNAHVKVVFQLPLKNHTKKFIAQDTVVLIHSRIHPKNVFIPVRITVRAADNKASQALKAVVNQARIVVNTSTISFRRSPQTVDNTSKNHCRFPVNKR